MTVSWKMTLLPKLESARNPGPRTSKLPSKSSSSHRILSKTTLLLTWPPSFFSVQCKLLIEICLSKFIQHSFPVPTLYDFWFVDLFIALLMRIRNCKWRRAGHPTIVNSRDVGWDGMKTSNGWRADQQWQDMNERPISSSGEPEAEGDGYRNEQYSLKSVYRLHAGESSITLWPHLVESVNG